MSDKEIRLLLVEDSVGDARMVCEMLAASENDHFRIYCADTLLASLEALAHATFDVAIVDLTLPDSQGLATFETLHRHAPMLPIVILTGLASDQLALQSMERGAQEYLVKGRINGAALIRVLHYAMARAQMTALGIATESANPTTCRLAGFMGAKGGVGCTTLATNYAVELARISGAKTLMMDLDSYGASSAFLLRAQSQYSISDAAQNLHRLDSDFWAGVATPVQGIELVLGAGAVEGAEEPPAERVRHVLRFARGLYRHIVVDMGRLTPYSASLLGEMDEIFVLVAPTLPDIYEAGRVIRKLAAANFPTERTRVVFNHVNRQSQAAINALEQAVRMATYATIPECGRELEESYSHGKFLDEHGPIRKHASQLAAKSLGQTDEKKEPKKSGLLHKLGLAS